MSSAAAASGSTSASTNWSKTTDAIVRPLAALAAALALFGAFVAAAGQPPLEVFGQMIKGAFGTWFSVQNTLLRAAPLLLTGLCTALPARLGLVVIGGEGALVVGGVTAAAIAPLFDTQGPLVFASMALGGMLMGAAW